MVIQMNNKLLWTLSNDTKQFKSKVQEEIKSIEQEIVSGMLLIQDNSEKLSREYALNIGKLEGLKFLEEYLTIEEDSIDESETILGTTSD